LGGSYIAPNPVTGNKATLAYWMAGSGNVEIRIFNAVGQMVARQFEVQSGGPQTSAVNLIGYASGVYLYLINMTYDTGESGSLPVSKFLVVH
jgi:hypothetical protein